MRNRIDIKEIKLFDYRGKAGYHMNVDGTFRLPEEVNPTTGPHDFNNCEHCQYYLNSLIKFLQEHFEGKTMDAEGKTINPFPDCCDKHRNLLKDKDFDRTLFIHVPEMAARKVIYTNQHIINYGNCDNWYKEITHYIKYVARSFGAFPFNCGDPLYLDKYFFYVTYLLEAQSDLLPEKKTRILEFLQSYQNPEKDPNSDYGLLVNIYLQWLELFPWSLNSYFKQLKGIFENCLPPVHTEAEVNIYTGLAEATLYTKSTLIELLNQLTNALLTAINGMRLYEQNLITDPQKIKLDLIIAGRKLKLQQGYRENAANEQKEYARMIEKWLEDEKNFFHDITQWEEENQRPNRHILSDREDPGASGEKSGAKKKSLLGLRHQALKIFYQGGTLPKNATKKLKQHYAYYHEKLNRIGTENTPKKMKNKIVLFEKVIKTLPPNKRQRANDELKVLKNLLS